MSKKLDLAKSQNSHVERCQNCTQMVHLSVEESLKMSQILSILLPDKNLTGDIIVTKNGIAFETTLPTRDETEETHDEYLHDA